MDDFDSRIRDRRYGRITLRGLPAGSSTEQRSGTRLSGTPDRTTRDHTGSKWNVLPELQTPGSRTSQTETLPDAGPLIELLGVQKFRLGSSEMFEERGLRDVHLGGELADRDSTRPLIVAGLAGRFKRAPLGRR